MTTDDKRTAAQFFFECGYGAAWGDAYLENGGKSAFTMSDATIERAWAIAPEAYPDAGEWDRNLSLACMRVPATREGDITAWDIAQAERHYPPSGWRREAIMDLARFVSEVRVAAQSAKGGIG